MKNLLILLLVFLSPFSILYGQYDFVIENLIANAHRHNQLELSIEIVLQKAVHGQEDFLYYDILNKEIDLCYIPKQADVPCGYFVLNDSVIEISGKYQNKFIGCDLDYGSFSLNKIIVKGTSFYLLNAINNGSGSSTRVVFSHLFKYGLDGKVVHYALWSMYGSKLSFGDYDFDGNLDFLEIKYAPENKLNDLFKLSFFKLGENGFVSDNERFIIFQRTFVDNGIPKIKILEKKGF